MELISINILLKHNVIAVAEVILLPRLLASFINNITHIDVDDRDAQILITIESNLG